MDSFFLRPKFVALAAGSLALLAGGWFVSACPFCAAPSRTLTEELVASDIVVLATLVEKGNVDADGVTTTANSSGESKFAVTKIMKGGEHLKDSSVSAFFFGDAEPGTSFLMAAMVLPEIKWTTPIPLSPRGVKYVSTLLSVPEKGPQRLAFFWQHLEDEDSLLAQDSYDEFARASYSDVIALKDVLNRKKIIGWINDPDIAQSRRRLYFTLLGVCGKPEDVPMLEAMMKSNDRRQKAGLDALIGCYIALRGADGIPLIEDLFLKKKEAEYSDTYAAIMAIRVMGQESDTVPRPRLLEALRYMLDRPDLADLVIPDLARWEDWSIMERMIKLFKDSNPKSNFVRVPVINYLDAATRQKGEVGERAKAAIDELAQIDPEAVKRAKAYAIFGPLAAKKPADPAEQPAGDAAAEPATTASPEKPAASGKSEAAPQTEAAPDKSSQAAPAAGDVQAANATAAPLVVEEAAVHGAAQGAPTAATAGKNAAASQPRGDGRIVDIDRSFGGRRLGMMFGLIGAMLVVLRVASRRASHV